MLGQLRDALRDTPVLILACGVALALAYSAALALRTHANNYDSLRYHLARAAFWKQEHAVEHIAGANDARLNVFPPASEIMSAWAMVLEGASALRASSSYSRCWPRLSLRPGSRADWD